MEATSNSAYEPAIKLITFVDHHRCGDHRCDRRAPARRDRRTIGGFGCDDLVGKFMARDDFAHPNTAPGAADRQRLMMLCAPATGAELHACLATLGGVPAFELIRAPEVGLVMVRGRIGGDGAPFNTGEATVTRAVVRIASGEIGFSYLLGRVPEKAKLAAIVDAIGQSAGGFARVETALVATVAARVDRETSMRRAETAATRVQFFTLVRGED